jgi:hypothetical protein
MFFLTKNLRVNQILKIKMFLFSIFSLFSLFSSLSFLLPDVEEFYLTIIPRDIGVLKFIQYFGISFSGRYSSNFLGAIHPFVYSDNVNNYKWYVFFLFCFSIGIIIIFARRYFLMGIIDSTLFSLFFSAILISVSPSLFMSLFFFSGSFVYYLPFIFFVINLIFFKELLSHEKKNTYKIISAIVLFFSIGLNESFLIFYLVIIGGLLIYFIKAEIKIIYKNLTYLIVALLSIFFFIAHPGNFNFKIVSNHFLISEILNQSFCNYVTIFEKYILRLEMIMLFFAASCIKSVIKLNYKFSAALIFLVLVLPYFMSLPYYLYSGNLNIQLKTYTPIVYLQYFLLLFFVFPYVWEKINYILSKKIILFLSFVCVCVYVVQFPFLKNNISVLYYEIKSGSLKEYYLFQDSIFKSISSLNKTNNSCNFICVENNPPRIPQLLYRETHDMYDRHSSYWNHSIEGFFNICEIRVLNSENNKFNIIGE